jgi:hypothetical protein
MGYFDPRYFDPRYFDLTYFDTGLGSPSVDNSLENLLNGYPEFLDKREGSVNYEYHKPLGDVIDQYLRDQILINNAENLDRPFKIWINQQSDYNYTLNYQVKLSGLMNVQLYQDGITPILIQDSGDLTGLRVYSGSYSTTSSNIIPLQQYYIQVTDINGNIFQKGYPENDTPQGDIYDHDVALDSFGLKWLIERRIYNPPTDSENYPKTIPPYFVRSTEADYWYEQRIKQFIGDYQTLPLPIAEIKRHLSFTPSLIGRWRETGNISDSPIFDVLGVLEEIPVNINFGTEGNCQAIIDRASPSGKKGFMQLTTTNPLYNPGSMASLVDSFNYNLNLENDQPMFIDSLMGAGVIPIQSNNIGIVDNVNFGLNLENDVFGFEDSLSFGDLNFYPEYLGLSSELSLLGTLPIGSGMSLDDKLNMTAYIPTLIHDTQIGFATDTLNNVAVVGTGSSAYVELTPVASNSVTSYPNTDDGTNTNGSAGSWYMDNPTVAWDNNINWYAECYPINGWTDPLKGKGTVFNGLSGIITGVEVNVWCVHEGGSGHPMMVQLTDDQNNIESRTVNMPYGTPHGTNYPPSPTQFGGANDLWNGLSSNINDYGNLKISITADSSNSNIAVYYVEITLYFGQLTGTQTSPTITAPSDGYGWNKLETSQSVPTYCSLNWDILKDSDNSIILSNQTPPVDLSSIPYQNIKVRGNFSTTNPSYYPTEDWYKVSYIKDYM